LKGIILICPQHVNAANKYKNVQGWVNLINYSLRNKNFPLQIQNLLEKPVKMQFERAQSEMVT
jgi:hypothetical protein